MKYITWEPRLNTGIEIIDAQHQRIVAYINELYSAVKGRDKRLVSNTIFQLLDYTQSHLRFEEELLEAAGYVELEAHRAVHSHFERRIHHYYKRHNDGQDIAIPLISELRLWLTTHILHDDREYVPTLLRYMEGITFPTSIAS
ncbi:MAG: bacteriohemerythrin [Chromatiales bacterium]|nr:bacteriohemerythrin [Chromatiales bacterium]